MYTWRRNPAKNLLSPENLDRITRALETGPIFGYWYRAHSGFGPAHWLGRQIEEFMAEVAQAKPGDLYVIWSLPALLAQHLALAAARYDDAPARGASLLTPDDMRAIEVYLSDPHNEFIALCFGTERGSEILVNDRDGLEYIAELAEWYNHPGGQIYVFPYTTIDPYTATDGPRYWVLDAQYPNERGEVRFLATHSSAGVATGTWLACAGAACAVLAAYFLRRRGRSTTA